MEKRLYLFSCLRPSSRLYILLWRGLGEYDVASTQWSGDLDEQSLVACVFEVWPHAVASEWQGDAIALAKES